MTTQRLFILAFLALVLLIGVGVFIFHQNTVQNTLSTLPPNNGLPSGNPILPNTTSSGSVTSPQPAETSATVSVGSFTTSVRSVRDFLHDADVVSVTPLSRQGVTPAAYFSLGSLPYEIVKSVSTTSASLPTSLERGYEILYSPEEGSFSIFIYKEPLGEMRQKAAEDITNRLAIPIADVCDLLTFVWVSPLANNVYAGKNVGFSGCVNAVVFPGDTQ